jgi:hypothetical protein
MLPEDRAAFIDFVQHRDSVVITEFTSASPDVQPVDPSQIPAKKDLLCLWNLALLSSLKRKHVPVSDVGPYYRIDSSLPILEFSVPNHTAWDGQPALTQGRLYAYAYQDHAALRTWYEALVRWLRKSFAKNPITWMSGYVGPAAYRWYENGGLLMPTYLPPVNPEWRARIDEQHRIR